jgi:hypothetical protein
MMVTVGAKQVLADGTLKGRKRQLAALSNLLILKRAVASFSDTHVPR